MNKKRLNVAILAIAAALAMSAVASTAASAGTFKAESYPATITGEQTTSVVFTGVVGKWSCKKLTMQGSLTSASSALNLTPVYSECAWAGVAATTFMEGCTYEFTAGETVEGSENKIQATMDIKCPAGKEVKLVLNGGTCTIWIPEQTGLGSATFENTPASTPDDVDLTLNLSGIKYRVETGFLGCPSGTNGTYTNGTIAGGVTLKADNGGGAPINWSVS
jgi:hypothetical protein